MKKREERCKQRIIKVEMDPATATDNNHAKIMKGCSSILDRLSSLPVSITGSILSFLPLREAAKTSVLSSSWRNRWRYIPELVFDNDFYDLQSNERKVNKDRLILLDIFSILLLHRGTITSLKFCIDELKSCPELDRLFLFLCGKNIQEFVFRIDGSSSYRLPSHIFSYDNLRILSLSSCVFKVPPIFGGFHRLARLSFYEVSFQCDDFHKCFISHCPLLECLIMVGCTGIDSFVIDFPNLKSLRLENCSFASFRYERSPQLGTIEILRGVYEKGSSNCFSRFFDCLPAAKSICVSYFFLKYLTTGESQKRLPIDIQSLEALEIHDISIEVMEEVSWVMCLIMSCPNLKDLKIKGYREALSESDVLFDYGELSNYSLGQLKRVDIENFRGSVHELEFVKFLLSKSASLEVLVAKFPVDTSPKAKIICVDPDKLNICVELFEHPI